MHNIGTKSNPFEAPVRVSGDVVEFYTRADSKEITESLAKQVNLLTEIKEVDPETGLKVGTGEWVLGKGVEMTRVGPVVIKPAVLDDKGNVVTPAVMDNRDHVNWRLHPPASLNFDKEGKTIWKNWARMWRGKGALDTSNKNEIAFKLNKISLIDPDSVATPTRRWLT